MHQWPSVPEKKMKMQAYRQTDVPTDNGLRWAKNIYMFFEMFYSLTNLTISFMNYTAVLFIDKFTKLSFDC